MCPFLTEVVSVSCVYLGRLSGEESTRESEIWSECKKVDVIVAPEFGSHRLDKPPGLHSQLLFNERTKTLKPAPIDKTLGATSGNMSCLDEKSPDNNVNEGFLSGSRYFVDVVL